MPVEGVAGSQLVVVDTETRRAEKPFEGASTSWGGQFSPDGSRLAACVQQEGMACLGRLSSAGVGVALGGGLRRRPGTAARC